MDKFCWRFSKRFNWHRRLTNISVFSHMKIAFVWLLTFIFFQSHAQTHAHRLKPGDHLPDVSWVDAFGDTTRSTALLGHKVLITFNRYVNCPLCNFRTHELLEHYDSLSRLGFIFISVYESGKETLTEYATKEEIPFIMIPNPDLSLYKLFKVKRSWLKSLAGLFHRFSAKHKPGVKLFKQRYTRDGHLNQIGADFLVDEKGIIHIAYYGKYVGDHYPVEEIVKWVKQ